MSISRSFLFCSTFMFASMTMFFSSARAGQPQTTSVGNVTFQCAPSEVKPIDDFLNGKWDFNGQLAAGTYAVYAAASYDAYEPRPTGISRAFHIADNDPALKQSPVYGKTGWIRAESRHANSSGLSYDVYYHDTQNQLDVMVAYRGTDGVLDRDWLANLSWVTQWFNPRDPAIPGQIHCNLLKVLSFAPQSARKPPTEYC